MTLTTAWQRNMMKAIGLILLLCVAWGSASAQELKWFSFDEGLAAAKTQGKRVYVFFWAEWCTVCHRMEKDTLQNSAVKTYLADHFISVKVNVDQEAELSTKYAVKRLPHSAFVSFNGKVYAHKDKYIPPDLFMKILKIVATTGKTAQ